MDRCEHCIFWVKTNHYATGECRRRAPIRSEGFPGVDSNPLHPIWPRTREGHGCGEHELRPIEPAGCQDLSRRS